ncbi:hypothetical protein QVD17_05570 [Tagetes erecta]|uniref:GBF-interacting protein 1 N-terminal domain-containing protein n=1 Tax=Tagetes erecta TaxID=13708 RepID=A0AAD8LLS4_TARER|nr:hypothetical protein QVD17_05570 [Tagetes erecta]
MSGGGRVSVPNNVRKTIQNIKEITGHHSEDEIYAMLKDCSMDPNETAQKLLLLDPFHEVKKKRDRKKENLNKEPTEPGWKAGMQGRGNRGGRLNYPSRRMYNDVGSGKPLLSARETGTSKGADNGPKKSMPQGPKNKETFVVKSSSRDLPDGIAHSSVGGEAKKSEVFPVVEASKGPTVGDSSGPLISSTVDTSASKTPSPSPVLYLSDKDPILMPSQDSWLPVGTIRREVGSQQILVDQIHETPLETESTGSGSEVGNSMQGKTPSSHVTLSVSRPSSNYNNRMQQAIGPQKVGPSMEWKPKPTNPVLAQGTGSAEPIKVHVVQVESQTPNPYVACNLDSKDTIPKLEKKLEESRISDDQHVIIPNHLHVPKAEKLGFYFGSFDASFSFNAISSNGPGSLSDKSSEASEVVDESIDEQPRNQSIASTSADDEDHLDHQPSSNNIPENLSAEGDVSLNSGFNHNESTQETSLPTSHHHQILHTSPNISFGFIPPMIGTHLTSFETNESHNHDGSQVPNFVVQQPFDPASYYAQLYRPGADVDGRMSPFHLAGVPTKFNGNIPVLSPQASQSSQEVGNSLMFSGAGPTPTATTQTGGFMQTSIAMSQQPLPVFRQPTGVHLPHYPPNFIPYGPYFPPFYVPPPAIHQFLSNNTFPQQPQAGNMYPVPPVPSPKYPHPQYKTGSNTGNPVNIGMPGSYGPYGLNPAGYNSGAAATPGNSTPDEDLGGSQFKESNGYITGQQSEGSGVWMTAPGRDFSGLQTNSFYNIHQGGQVAYTPTQVSHGTFASVYHHPTQPVTTSAVHPLLQQSQTLAGPGVDMVGPTPQINWPNNY